MISVCDIAQVFLPLLSLHFPQAVPLLTDPLPLLEQLWLTRTSDSVTAKQAHNEKCLHISPVSQTLFETKSPYRTCVLFTVLIGGKISALCISTVLLKQDKDRASRSDAVAIE